MSKVLCEMFGVRLDEVSPAQAERELNGAQSVFKRPQQQRPQSHTRDTARMQADVDSATSVAKNEAAGGEGITLSGDKETLGALMECLQEAEHSAETDVANWAGRAWKAVAAGIRGNGSFSLPKFEQTPDELMPDDGGDEEGGF